MGMQDMLEIFVFKECMRAWVKSCDKFGNMNDDYIDKQTFFDLSHLPIYAPSWSGRELFEHPSYRVFQINRDNIGCLVTFLLFIRTRSNLDTVRI